MTKVMHYTKQRRCEECGNLFTIKSGTQRYCPGPHHTKCKICGKDIEYTCSPKEKPSYCSKECRNKGHEKTVMERYGVKNVSELQSVRDRISERNSSKEVDEKRRKHNLEKWGVEFPQTLEEVKERQAQTNLEKYGTVSTAQAHYSEKTKEIIFDKNKFIDFMDNEANKNVEYASILLGIENSTVRTYIYKRKTAKR